MSITTKNSNRSAPHLAEEARKAPITTVREAEAASNKAITKIDGQVRTALGQIPEETVNGNSILDSARKAVDAVKRTPEERAAATKLLEGLGIRGDIGILDADQLRERLNAELSGEYDKTGSDRATLRKTNSSYAANEAAANALRDAIYDRMEARGITEARELRRDQGALMNMRDHYHDNMVKSEAADAKPQPNTPLQKAARQEGKHSALSLEEDLEPFLARVGRWVVPSPEEKSAGPSARNLVRSWRRIIAPTHGSLGLSKT